MYEIEPKSFHETLNRSIQRANDRLHDYLKDPSEENVHDTRTAIRRLETAFRVLPKKLRGRPRVEDFVTAYIKFFKINSKIRDFDIILSKTSSDESISALILKKKEKRLVDGKRQAEKAAEEKTPEIKLEDINRSKLEKRFSRLAFELIESIQKLMPKVVSDEKKIEELHELRKGCKKLRYLLELTGSSKESRLVTHLKQMQDLLGAIRDSDITIDFLKSLDTKYDAGELIKGESELRRQLYQKFSQEHKIFTVQ